MKSKSSKVIAMLVTAILLVSVAPAFAGVPKQPHPANAMWIEDKDVPYWAVNLTTANALHTIGYKFNITVWVNITSVESPAVGIDTWQTKVYFNTAYLQAVRTNYTGPGFAKSQLFETLGCIPVTPEINNVAGYVYSGETCAPNIKAVPAAGSLMSIEFNVTAVPPKGSTLTSLFNIKDHTGDNWVTDDQGIDVVGGATGSAGLYNGYYEFKWQAPPSPILAVEHDGFYGTAPSGGTGAPDEWPLTYGPYAPSAIGASFDVKIYIEGLNPAWELWSASLCLCYNTSVIDVIGLDANVTIDAAWFGPNTASVTHGVPDEVNIFVQDCRPPPPSGKVLVATVTFTVMMQGGVPPLSPGAYDKSDLTFCNVVLEDHTMLIPTPGPHKEGEVIIYALQKLASPWLEVSPTSIVIGGIPAIGTEFDINVNVANLDSHWYMVAYQFRLTYDPDLLDVVNVTEGPFLTNTIWNWYGTFFVSYVEPAGMFPPHVVVGDFLIPANITGEYDQTEFPHTNDVNPTLATIRFKALKQGFCFDSKNLTCDFDLLPFWYPTNCHFVDRDGYYIPTNMTEIVNGIYTMMPNIMSGRLIDLTGGAVNRDYGVTYGTPAAFPAPYGGQGPNANMDLVIPQSVVYLLADVTYNHWPIQSKDVGYEIEGPFYQEGWTAEKPVPKPTPPFHVRKYANRTDDQGVAWIKFQMPWPCENPEDYFGKYRVTATVDICGVVVTDTLWFDYYYLVEITKVTTDKYYYEHCEDVEVTIEFRTKAQQYYNVSFAVVIQDELETDFGWYYVESFTVGGAPFCHWREYTVENQGAITVPIHVVKWAFAGIAKILVSAFDKDPTEGGAPWCPTYGMGWPLDKEVPEILILPQ